jgi:hypothetical protein
MRIVNKNAIGQRKLLIHWFHNLSALASLVERSGASVLVVALQGVVLKLALPL